MKLRTPAAVATLLVGGAVGLALRNEPGAEDTSPAEAQANTTTGNSPQTGSKSAEKKSPTISAAEPSTPADVGSNCFEPLDPRRHASDLPELMTAPLPCEPCAVDQPSCTERSETPATPEALSKLGALERKSVDLFAWRWFLYLVEPLDPHTGRPCSEPSTFEETPSHAMWCGAGPRSATHFPRFMSWFPLDDVKRKCEGFRGDSTLPDPVVCADRSGAIDRCRCEGHCFDAGVPGTEEETPERMTEDYLFDQNGAPVQYEIRVNPVWRTRKEFISFTHGGWRPDGPDGGGKTEPSVAAKFAWKVVGPNDEVRSAQGQDRFFLLHDVKIPRTRLPNAASDTSDSEFATRDLALVGLHMVFKTATYEEWIWATFEHLDNVPSDSDDEALFFDHDCKNPKHCEANTYVDEPAAAAMVNVPAQLTRLFQNENVTRTLNQEMGAWLTKQGSLWKYYRLIDTQFVAVTGPRAGTSEPKSLRNPVIEPFGKQGQSASCIDCHREGRDFTFQSRYLCKLTDDLP